MKIRLVHKDGTFEVITLLPPVEIIGETHLRCGDGTDHFFTDGGFYDGWGRSLPEGLTEDEAYNEILRIQDGNQIISKEDAESGT